MKKTEEKTGTEKKTAEKKTAVKETLYREMDINGAVVQAYPLTAAQRIHYYTVNACHREELLNIGIGFYIQYSDVNFDVLKECIADGYRKFDSMRLRFATDENGQGWQYLVPSEDREIKVYDFSFWKEEDAHDEMRRWTRIPLDRNGGPMNEIALIRLPGDYNGIYMKVHHLTMDSTAIMSFCGYVLQLYCHKLFENVDPPALPRHYLDQLVLDFTPPSASITVWRICGLICRIRTFGPPISPGIWKQPSRSIIWRMSLPAGS